MSVSSFDLTKRPPRSPRVRLGGYVILPRMLDKCRAVLAGTAGEYKYACPLDQRFLEYAGIDPEALKAKVQEGLGDAAILAWINENAVKRHPAEIAQWSAYQEKLAPTRKQARTFFNEVLANSDREDIETWFDLLDFDDYVSYGGNA
jgi:hypothetical protein